MSILGRWLRRVSPNQRGVVSIMSGTAIGQVVALALAPVIARLYGPSQFGTFAVLSALVVIFGTISAMRLELAVPLPKDESDAYSLVALGGLFIAGFGITGTVVVGLAGAKISAAVHQPGLMPWLWAVPALASLMSAYLLLNQLAIRQRRFGSIGRRSALQSSTVVLAQIAAGVAGIKGGLVLGYGFGQLVGALSLTFGSGLRGITAHEGRARSQMRRALSRYRRFPLFLAPSGLLNVLGQQLPILLISYWYGSGVAGWLGLTLRVLAVPVTLLGTAVAQVYLSEISRAARGDLERAKRLFWKSSRLLVIAAAVLFLVLLLFGPALFALIFGEPWRESGEYARALSLGLAGQMIGSPLSQTLIAFERQGTQLFWDSLRVVSTCVVVAVAVWIGASPIAAMWSIGGLSASLYGLSWYLSFRCLRSATPRT